VAHNSLDDEESLNRVCHIRFSIGYLVWNSWALLQVDIMFVGMVTMGILAHISSVLFQEIERKVIPWKADA
jgi:ABC-type nitrate/sulfonate/bicarbonate transport system permease component